VLQQSVSSSVADPLSYSLYCNLCHRLIQIIGSSCPYVPNKAFAYFRDATDIILILGCLKLWTYLSGFRGIARKFPVHSLCYWLGREGSFHRGKTAAVWN